MNTLAAQVSNEEIADFDESKEIAEDEKGQEKHDLQFVEMNLQQSASKVMADIRACNSFSVLSQGFTKEQNTGRRPHVLRAFTKQLAKLNPANNQGEGSQEARDAFDDLMPNRAKEQTDGDGARSTPQSHAERKRRKGKQTEMDRQINDLKTLMEHTTDKRTGIISFEAWGHIIPKREEKRLPNGNIDASYRDPIIVLKECPRCGKVNRPEKSVEGVCGSCDLEGYDFVKKGIEAGLLKGIVFKDR